MSAALAFAIGMAAGGLLGMAIGMATACLIERIDEMHIK